MVTGSKLTFTDTYIHTLWASEAERWGQAHWATGQQNTEVLCSLECSLDHSLTLILLLWPDWDLKLDCCPIRVRLTLGLILSPGQCQQSDDTEVSSEVKGPSWPLFVSVLKSSVLFGHLLAVSGCFIAVLAGWGHLKEQEEYKYCKNVMLFLRLFHHSKKK